MATVLYKDGESIRVHHTRITAHLALGWSLDCPSNASARTDTAVDTSEVTPPARQRDPDMPDDPIADIGGVMSVAEIRQRAKAAGISGWDKKRISRIKKELGIE
jgi:hypothetical protein